MGEVIDLEQYRRDTKWISGPAKCVGCGAVWVAVVPDHHAPLECPECGLDKGVFNATFEPEEGTLVRECACGGQLYLMTEHGLFCVKCGDYQD